MEGEHAVGRRLEGTQKKLGNEGRSSVQGKVEKEVYREINIVNNFCMPINELL